MVILEIKLDRNKELPNGWTVKEAYGHYKDMMKEAKEENWETRNISFREWLNQLMVVKF